MSALNPLTDQELLNQAPTLFTKEPHFEVSDKYHFIPTIDVINEIKSHNWYPTAVQEASVKEVSKNGYQIFDTLMTYLIHERMQWNYFYLIVMTEAQHFLSQQVSIVLFVLMDLSLQTLYLSPTLLNTLAIETMMSKEQ